MMNFHVRLVGQLSLVLCVVPLLAGCGLFGHHASVATATRYQAEGKYRAAYIDAKKVLQRDQKNGAAWLLLGKASLMLGDTTNALSELGKARANGVQKSDWMAPTGRALLVSQKYHEVLKTLPADPSLKSTLQARVTVLRGRAWLGLKKPDRARKAFRAALALEPSDPRALTGLARLSMAAKDTASAKKYLQRALAAAPDSTRAWVLKGDIAFNAGDFAQAASSFQKALAIKHPGWVPQAHFYALARLTSAETRQGEFDQALTHVEAMEKIAPKQPYPHYLHALLLYKQGHLDKAVSQLQKVLKTSPNNVQAQSLLGAVNYAKGNYGQAQMYLSNVMGVDPGNHLASKFLALTYYREGRKQQALDSLRPTVSGHPSDSQLLASLEKAVAAGVGVPGAAGSASGTKAAATKPGAVAARSPALASSTAASPIAGALARADKALVARHAGKAIRMLEAIPASNATTAAQRATLLVMAYARAGQNDSAVKTARAYAAKHPRAVAAHLLYGTALVGDGQRSKARTQYALAHKLDPDNLAVLLSMGGLDALEGHYRDAAGRYQAVLKKHPGNAGAMTELGELAARQGEKSEAIDWFKKAIAANPNSLAPYLRLVRFYTANGQFEDAADTARKLAGSQPDNPVALNALGIAELDSGHRSAALKALHKAVGQAPGEPLYRINLARAQIADEDPKAAEANLEQLIKSHPTRTRAVAMLAFVKLHRHDLPGALALARKLQEQTATKVAGFALEGDLYMADKSWHNAERAYQRGLKVKASRPLVVRSFEARLAAGEKQPQTVLRDWLNEHPKDAVMRLRLAQYYLGHQQDTSAATQYQRVLKAHPASLSALNNLAWIYTQQHDPKALALAKRAYQLASTSPGVMDTYAWALLADHQSKTALPILERAAKAAPKVAAIQYHLAVAQARTGNKVGARATLGALQKSGAKFPGQEAARKLYQKLQAGR